MSYQIRIEKNLKLFASSCEKFIYTQEDLNNSLINGIDFGLKQNVSLDRKSHAFSVLQNEQVVWAGLHIERSPFLFTEGPAEIGDLLVKTCLDQSIVFPRFMGPTSMASQIAQQFQKNGINYEQVMQQEQYRVTKVNKPLGLVGRMRPADVEDIEIIRLWLKMLDEEMGQQPEGDEAAVRTMIRNLIRRQYFFLWENEGQLTAMVSLAGESKGGIRVNNVYTAPEHRRKSYASHLVASVSQYMINKNKKFCVLYVDTKNSAITELYRKLGYEKIANFKYYQKQP